jgi:hypothetical protein
MINTVSGVKWNEFRILCLSEILRKRNTEGSFSKAGRIKSGKNTTCSKKIINQSDLQQKIVTIYLAAGKGGANCHSHS